MSTESKDFDPPDTLIRGVTGIILAGGKSLRFGHNKALVELKGTRLIERVVNVLGAIFEKVILISNSPHEYEYLQLPIYEDLIKGLGPISGFQTGLNKIEDPAGFFVACDMPFLNEALIRHIVGSGVSYDAVIPRLGWKIEALHALYTKGCLTAINHSITAGNYQLITFLDKVRVRYIEEEVLRRLDPELKSFININRPQELDRTWK
ncbi:MAG: molybdenum cofactor guanylyltransferase [Deltaproteobacteria bacterium]|nr:molybdenum cofactor guanylyltransferase [Deltaproteobacteria bacterium]